jgi:hypothetical protein
LEKRGGAFWGHHRITKKRKERSKQHQRKRSRSRLKRRISGIGQVFRHQPLPEVGGTGSTFQYPQGTRPGIMRTGPLPHTFPRSHRPLPEVGGTGSTQNPIGGIPTSGQAIMGGPNPYSYFIFETGIGIMRTGPLPHTFPRSHRPLPEVGGTGSTQHPIGGIPTSGQAIMGMGPHPDIFPISYQPLQEVGGTGPTRQPRHHTWLDHRRETTRRSWWGAAQAQSSLSNGE